MNNAQFPSLSTPIIHSSVHMWFPKPNTLSEEELSQQESVFYQDLSSVRKTEQKDILQQIAIQEAQSEEDEEEGVLMSQNNEEDEEEEVDSGEYIEEEMNQAAIGEDDIYYDEDE
jgi:hypothetical protein